MKRRKFLLSSVLGTAAVTVPIIHSCKPQVEKSDVQGLALTSDLDEISIAGLSDKLKAGTYASEDVVKMIWNGSKISISKGRF